jgi:hypothetical protein
LLSNDANAIGRMAQRIGQSLTCPPAYRRSEGRRVILTEARQL